MATTIKTQDLRKALAQVSYLDKRTTLPICAGVLLEVSDSKCVLKSTDLERYITMTIPAEGDKFKGVVGKRQLGKFLVNGDGCVSISLNKGNVVLNRQDIGALTLYEQPKPTEYPPEPLVTSDSVVWYTTNAKWFCGMVGIISQACAPEQNRPILTGVVFKDGAVAAADGFRLYVFKNNKLNFGLGTLEATIQYQTLNIVRKIFSKSDSIAVGFEKHADKEDGEERIRNVIFKDKATTLVCNAILGTYPKYEQLIPNSFDVKVVFSSPLMSQRLQLIDEREIVSGLTRFQLSQDAKRGDVCLLSSGEKEYINYSLSLPVKVDGNRISKVAVNYKYLLNAIKPFSICNMEFSAPHTPIKITGDIEGLIAVIMPMFTQW